MDTINVTMKLGKKLTEDEYQRFVSGSVKSWVFSFKEINSPMVKDKNTYTFTLSFPRFYDKQTNAYLITKQSEVDYVIETLFDFVEIKLENSIVSAIATRIDYPFTFLMDEGRDYNSYRGIFEILAKASNIMTVKNIEEMRENKKETHIFSSFKDSTKRVDKIMIYNQHKKIMDKRSKIYLEIQNRYPDLKRRMRIEISLMTHMKLKKLKLKKIKEKTYDYIMENLFDENLIELFLIKEVGILREALQKEKDISNKVFAGAFIYKNNPASYEVFRKAVKDVYSSTRSRENFMNKSKVIFKKREAKENVIYFKIKDEIEKLKKSLKREKMRSTK